MYRKRMTLMMLSLLLVGLPFAGCSPQSADEPIAAVESDSDEPARETATLAPRQATENFSNTPFEAPMEAAPAQPATPEAVVQAFYDWYLAYIGGPAAGNFRNPLVDGAYHDAPYLTDGFAQHIDELLERLRTEFDGGGYDPFLCAQNIPREIGPRMAFLRNGQASVVVGSSFTNHILTVDLRQEDHDWTITNITCAFSPEGSAKAFYTWYLGYIGDRSSEQFRNPLVDRAYRDHLLVAEAFVEQVDQTLDGFSGGGFDPFLLAQDIPQDFSVDPGVEPGTAVIHLQFGPDAVAHRLVRMAEVGSRWQITAIGVAQGLPTAAPETEAANTNRLAYVNQDYGFSFSHPESWGLQALALDVAGIPEDWPVEAAWLLMPLDIAESLKSGGLPDPNAVVILAPFNVEVVVGDRQALERVYGSLDGETADLNGLQLTILHRDPGYTHAIIAHPRRPDTWVVFTDWVTGFPGREGQAGVATPEWQPLLDSLQFGA